MTSTRCQRIGKRSHPKAFFEFGNLMSFYGNRVSVWCYNNPLENGLMRWFIWVTLRVSHSTHNRLHNIYSGHRVPTYTGTSSGEQAALFTRVCVGMRWMDGWQTSFHVTFLSLNRDTMCLSHWPSLLERQQREQMMCCEPPSAWPLTLRVL